MSRSSPTPARFVPGSLAVLVDEGLGNSTYLLDLGDGSALVVDASRDLRAVRAAAGRRGLRLRYAADTHLHADFLSGSRQLAHDDGAQVLASTAGRRQFTHRGLADGDEVDLGGLTLQAWTTPGHTDEHLSFLLRDGSRPVGVFSGGALLVGSAARTDLLGPERTEQLTRAQYRSLHRLAGLPTDTALWPTHGAGSFCSSPPGAERTSTIGIERATNPLLQLSEDDFVSRLLGSLGSYPSYFRRLGELNRRGPQLLGPATGVLPALPAADVARAIADGAVVVDLRPVPEYAQAHLPGALSIPLRAQFATWLGWLVEPDQPVVLVAGPGQDLAEAVWSAAVIGYDGLVGVLDGGLDGWRAAGRPVASTPLVTPAELAVRPTLRVVDIRQDAEYVTGHLPGAEHVELGRVAAAPGELPRLPTVVMCGHGERAASAASLLERAGHRDVEVLLGGPQDWAAVAGRGLETG